MLKKNQGFTIIEVLIAASLLMIVSLAVANLLTMQQQEVRSIKEKLSTTDLESLTKKLIMNDKYCQCLFKGNTFNSVTKTWNTFPTGLPSTFDATCASVGGDLFKVGNKLPNANIVVGGFAMKNIFEIVLGSGNYVGDLDINFKADGMVRAVKNVNVSMGFTVNPTDPPAAQNVTTCGVEVSGGGGDWVAMPTASGAIHQAPDNGFLLIKSCLNCGIKFSAGPAAAAVSEKGFVSARDKYGQGYETMTVPVKKNQFWKAESTNVNQNVIGNPLDSIFFMPM
jgi:type II secretory pathway pseudopilin PulG